ncbi:MAG: hypothetical protein AAF654_12340 [Myxococcota bacterium]
MRRRTQSHAGTQLLSIVENSPTKKLGHQIPCADLSYSTKFRQGSDLPKPFLFALRFELPSRIEALVNEGSDSDLIGIAVDDFYGRSTVLYDRIYYDAEAWARVVELESGVVSHPRSSAMVFVNDHGAVLSKALTALEREEYSSEIRQRLTELASIDPRYAQAALLAFLDPGLHCGDEEAQEGRHYSEVGRLALLHLFRVVQEGTFSPELFGMEQPLRAEVLDELRRWPLNDYQFLALEYSHLLFDDSQAQVTHYTPHGPVTVTHRSLAFDLRFDGPRLRIGDVRFIDLDDVGPVNDADRVRAAGTFARQLDSVLRIDPSALPRLGVAGAEIDSAAVDYIGTHWTGEDARVFRELLMSEVETRELSSSHDEALVTVEHNGVELTVRFGADDVVRFISARLL